MAKSAPRRRSPNLGEDDIAEVLAILDGWAEPRLTWEMLISRVRSRLGSTYTRQGLHRHRRIAEAYAHRRSELAAQPASRRRHRSAELQAAYDRIERLEAKIRRLEGENSTLIERFIVWAYNAHAHGLSEDRLNRPLPRAERR